jgi:hypothetical protein
MLWECMVSLIPTSLIIAMNMVIAFYAATFPGIVQDLPEVIKSEQEVLDGTREYVIDQ